MLLNAYEVRGLCLVTFLALEWIVKGAIYAFPSSTSKCAIVMFRVKPHPVFCYVNHTSCTTSKMLKHTTHEDPQATFFCDQHDFLVATDALFSKGDKRISCCGNLISTLISGQKT